MFDAFACIDGGGEGVTSADDRKIQMDEWLDHYHTVGGRGFKALQDWALSEGKSTEEKVRITRASGWWWW